jgi:predicted DsbA family dithiol-disulfide isomerase
MSSIEITHFSDVLCVWAYLSQARMNAISHKFGESVHIECRFCSVFADTAQKIESTWKDKGSYDGFNSHLRQIAQKYPHIQLHHEVWLKTRPASSASCHLFLKAIQLLDDKAVRTGSQGKTPLFDQVVWATRCAFFRDCLDIARWEVQSKIAEQFGIKVRAVQELIHSGLAFARLAADYQEADKMRIEGSPSLVLNQGRQKLYGNVGFRIIEANILELLRQPQADDASWC